MNGAVTTFEWTSIPITAPPSSTPTSYNPTTFRQAAEMLSAINAYESKLSNDPDFSSVSAMAASAVMGSDPLDLASQVIAAYPTTPEWFSSAPQSLQTYVLSVASMEQSLWIDDPQETGTVDYNPGPLSDLAQMVQSVREYEDAVRQSADYAGWSSVAATATGLDNIEPSRDPVALAKFMENSPTPTWFSQMPLPLQTYVKSIVDQEVAIVESGIFIPDPSTTTIVPESGSENGGIRVKAYGSGVLAAAFLIIVLAL